MWIKLLYCAFGSTKARSRSAWIFLADYVFIWYMFSFFWGTDLKCKDIRSHTPRPPNLFWSFWMFILVDVTFLFHIWLMITNCLYLFPFPLFLYIIITNILLYQCFTVQCLKWSDVSWLISIWDYYTWPFVLNKCDVWKDIALGTTRHSEY